jgi:transposase
VVHSDETSWWVGGAAWWLWVFVNSDSTLYLVNQGRGRSVVTELLSADFAGVLGSDCLALYDDATPRQQKCYAHHHKAIRQAKELHPRQREGFLNDVAAMLRGAVALQAQKPECDPESFQALRQALERSPRSEPSEEAVRNRLAKQRDHLFTFFGSRRS